MLFNFYWIVILFLLLCLFKCSLLVSLFKYGVLISNLIFAKCFIDNKYIYPLLVNFSYIQANHLSRCQKKTFFIILFKKHFNLIFFLATKSLVRSKHSAIKTYLFFLYYIVVNKLEDNFLLIKSCNELNLILYY